MTTMLMFAALAQVQVAMPDTYFLGIHWAPFKIRGESRTLLMQDGGSAKIGGLVLTMQLRAGRPWVTVPGQIDIPDGSSATVNGVRILNGKVMYTAISKDQ